MLLLPFEFRMPRLVLHGPGSLRDLEKELSRMDLKKTMIVTSDAIKCSDHYALLLEMLSRSLIDTSCYTIPTGEPTVISVRDGVNQFLKDRCDSFFAIGGGSCIDTAKAIGILATNGADLKHFTGQDRIIHPLPPIVAIPSTGGSGSEVSRYAMITDPEERVKMKFSSPLLIPEIAVSDPLLTVSLSPLNTAAVGLDAFCHALESLTSKKEQPLTNILALSAIKLISEHLRKAWCDGTDIKARSGVMLAGILGGICTTNSSATLIHAMSRPLSAIFDIPHGLANASLLPTWAEFTFLSCPEKFRLVAETMNYGPCSENPLEGARMGIDAIRSLCRDLEVPCIEEMGIDIDDFENSLDKMADDALTSDTTENNPRSVTRKQIIELYKKAYLG
ncbi:MAG TPA: iron-containing alcohol dehydrogenase [Synergistales bacterium]|nr:iron-containing alcohol dehydrogenase [Synergistales bacterium]